MGAIRLENVEKWFGDKQILKGIDLDIEDGEFIVFVGPSGCGKSTLLRVIAGLEDASLGKVFLNEVDVTAKPPYERELSMVFQAYALYPHMSVASNIGFPLKTLGLGKSKIDKRVQEVAEILQLEEYLQRRPKDLSGGQRQRVAIGRAIVREPKGFLFDEPLSNLDAGLRVDMRLELSKLHRVLKTTSIYVTHDQVEAMTLADRIVVLRDGIIEQVGAPKAIYQKPQNTFVAQFIGSPKMNLFPAAMVPELGLDKEVVTVGVRPNHIKVTSDPQSGLKGLVEASEYLGTDTYLYVEVDKIGRLTIKIDSDLTSTEKPDAESFPSFSYGEKVSIDFIKNSLHYFDIHGQRLDGVS